MLVHQTRYRYDRPVHLGPQTIRLHPMPGCASVLSHGMDITPTQHACTWDYDVFGNRVARVTFTRPVTHFDITVRLTTDQTPTNPFHFTIAPSARTWPAGAHRATDPALAPYLLQPACPPVTPTGTKAPSLQCSTQTG